MFAIVFICGNLFLRIAGKIAKIRTRKNFVRHGKYMIHVFLEHTTVLLYAQVEFSRRS